MTVNKLQLPAKDNAVQLKINEIIDNLGGGGANTDLSNLTATGESHFQSPLVSGTNIKTINNNSILGSGNLTVTAEPEIFIAEYGVTTYQEVLDAYNAGKALFVKAISGFLPYKFMPLTTYNGSNTFTFGIINVRTSSRIALNSITGWAYNGDFILVGSSSGGTVGNASTPIYINSENIATSTGLSIASSRFDGQWVAKYLEVSTATSKASRTHDLSSYLPSGTGTYEIFVRVGASYGSATAALGVGTSASPWTNKASAIYATNTYVTSNSRNSISYATIPVSNKTLYSEVSAVLGSAQIALYGYRRVGTNT